MNADDRTQDIAYWKGELTREIGAMGGEIDNLTVGQGHKVTFISILIFFLPAE